MKRHKETQERIARMKAREGPYDGSRREGKKGRRYKSRGPGGEIPGGFDLGLTLTALAGFFGWN